MVQAAEFGHLELCRLMVFCGDGQHVAVEQLALDKALIHASRRKGNAGVVEFLLLSGACPNAVEGASLVAALTVECVESIKLLIKVS